MPEPHRVPTDAVTSRLRDHLAREYFGNSLLAWIIAASVILAAALIAVVVRHNVRRRATQWAALTGADGWIALRDLADATKGWFVAAAALYVGSASLTLPPRLRHGLNSLAILAFLLQAGYWGSVMLRIGLERWMRPRISRDPAGVMMATFAGYVARLLLWSLVIMLMLENIGVQVTALVAGLGIGGAAVALASQTILADLFASFSIVVDQPFVLGDFIVVGDVQGTVEQIGIKTVHIRALSGEQLIVPSNDLLRSRIRNFQRMNQRRIQFNFTVFPNAAADKLAALPGVVREIIEAQPQVRFDRAHLQSFGDFGVRFEVVYFVLTPDFNRYMDLQQTINLELLRRMDAEGLAIAYQKGLLPPSEADAAGNLIKPDDDEASDSK